MNTVKLNTTRLELIPLSRNQLIDYLAGDEILIRELGPVSRDILTEALRVAINLKLEIMAGIAQQDQPWITYWLMVLKENQSGIGMLGYKGAPDYRGQVEIGYGIDPAYQNQGYTTEAVNRLIRWAFKDPRCQRITAPGTRKDNPASNQILEKVGMKIYQETTDAYSWALDRSVYSENP
ncbi:MAG: GNAT family N-acetyltransferase [Anaerolineales bacterium]